MSPNTFAILTVETDVLCFQCISNGGVAPFVGHNAFLRWRALQEASFIDEDGIRSVWSSAHVSEDFDQALRLLQKGYIVRWATYSQNEFLEGVSLTPDDEVNRWQKYAFGCSELILNTFSKWPTRGPLSKNFRTFLGSKCTTAYKFDACSYIFSYWALATAVPLNIGLFFAQGFWGDKLDPVFLPPWNTLLSIIIVFIGGGNVALIISQARSGRRSFFDALLKQVMWIPALVVFFGGLSFHILIALIAHPFGVNMTWSATVKDVEESNFFIEVPRIFKRFWACYLVMFLFIASMIVVNLPFVGTYAIQGWPIYVPACLLVSFHILYPIVLSPYITRFSF